MTTLCAYSIYRSTSNFLSFIISNMDKHEFSCIWKWISYCNDVVNHVDCVIKRDLYPQKMHSCSKNIRGKSKKKKTYIMGNIAWIFALLKDKF